MWFVIGLVVGVLASYLLGRWAYNKQYNREKRIEKIQRELEQEAREKELTSPRHYTVYFHNPVEGEMVLDSNETRSCYMARSDRYGNTLQFTLVTYMEERKE